MSIWTHVNAAIRFDGIPGVAPQTRPDLGNTYHYDDDESVFSECNVPCGSEGSLQYRLVEYDTGLPWLAAHIWGDLRDYENIDAIVAYLTRIVAGQIIRSGIAEIAVEGQPEQVWQYHHEEEKGWQLVEESP